MNINFVLVNIPPDEKNVTLQSFLMLKVKARSRHASPLKTKETRRFCTPANLPHYQFLLFQRTRLRQLSVREQVEQKSLLKFLNNSCVRSSEEAQSRFQHAQKHAMSFI